MMNIHLKVLRTAKIKIYFFLLLIFEQRLLHNHWRYRLEMLKAYSKRSNVGKSPPKCCDCSSLSLKKMEFKYHMVDLHSGNPTLLTCNSFLFSDKIPSSFLACF